HRSGNRELLFEVEEQALVAADDQIRRQRIAGADRADVETAYAVLAAEEQLLEDRQLLRAGELVDVLDLPAHAERHPVVLLDVPDAFDHRLVEVRVAAKTGEVDRRRETLAVGREDRLVHGVVDEARRHLRDDALAALAEEQRIAQERIALQDGRVRVDFV